MPLPNALGAGGTGWSLFFNIMQLPRKYFSAVSACLSFIKVVFIVFVFIPNPPKLRVCEKKCGKSLIILEIIIIFAAQNYIEMKKTYQIPQIEIVVLCAQDTIATSGMEFGRGDGGNAAEAPRRGAGSWDDDEE